MLAHGLVDHSFFLLDLAFAFFLTLALVQHLRRLAPSPSPDRLLRGALSDERRGPV